MSRMLFKLHQKSKSYEIYDIYFLHNARKIEYIKHISELLYFIIDQTYKTITTLLGTRLELLTEKLSDMSKIMRRLFTDQCYVPGL